ncbi:MAG: aminotransferase class IV [Isosphaeraceae bacterium]|nr:aminotransferase class IV [Isosphaeraceae bacterium]
MESLACLNGELMPADRATVSIWDRGFTFGDAVYEVCRLYAGRCWLEDEHMARLRRSLNEMGFVGVDLNGLEQRMHRTISESGIEEGTVYLHITRGVAPRLHAFPDPAVVPPTELIVVRPYDDTTTAEKRAAGVAVISHPDLRWKRCDVKSTNLLANVIANEAAQRAGAYEAILIDTDGQVTEATHSSVLWVRDGRLEGTPEGPGILPGTTRRFVQGLAPELGIPFVEAQITFGELLRAEEVLLAGTTIEVLPVVRVDGQPIGSGRPGAVAGRLQAAFRAAVERWLAPEPV